MNMKLLPLLLVFAVSFSHAQGLKKIKTVEVSDTIIDITIDRPGDVYVVTKTGQFQKFDRDGHLIVLYKEATAPTLFDPHDGARLFAYYRDRQFYVYMNGSFRVNAGYSIDSAFVIQPWLICPSGDHRLWVLDAADHSLKNVDARNAEVSVEVEVEHAVIEDVTTIRTMRDYQGFVFLLKPGKGIYIFSRMGKFIREISAPSIRSFNFLGEELYYLEGNKIKFFDLFTSQTRELNVAEASRSVVVGEDRLYVMGATSVTIYEFKP